MGGSDSGADSDTSSMSPTSPSRASVQADNGVAHKRVTRSAAAMASAPAEHTNGTSLSVAASARNGHDSKEPETTKLGSTEKQPSSVSSQHHPTSKWTWFGYLLLVIVSKYTLPDDLRPSRPTLAHVWYYGWVTALSTGLGAAPLLLAHDMGKQMLGVGNAIAAGMMMSASYSLVTEGAMVDEADGVFREGMMGILSPAWARVALGVLAGLLFILSTKKVLDNHEDLKLGGLQGADAKKVLLIVFVMTLHSFSEGVGIGVSFGGAGGARLGFIISATLAVHNVPEGLAVALVLNPRGVSKLNTGLWCVFTSLPQPLMAVPAFLFVGQFLPFLPVGLGFAAGAMFWVACFELFVEAVEDSSKTAAVLTTAASFCTMLWLHTYLDHEL